MRDYNGKTVAPISWLALYRIHRREKGAVAGERSEAQGEWGVGVTVEEGEEVGVVSRELGEHYPVRRRRWSVVSWSSTTL